MTQVGVKAAVALTCVLLGMAVLAVADTVEVAAVGLTFQPPDVIINEGDSVHWTGLEGGIHTVAEVDDAAAFVWNGGFHSPGAASEFTFTFTAPGLFHYICEPHVLEGMRGTVTVNEVQDCNNNGAADAQDIADGTSLDCNANTIPDECEFPGCPGILPADMNCDGDTNGADVQRFVDTFVAGDYTCPADMNQDGALDESDVPMFVDALLGV